MVCMHHGQTRNLTDSRILGAVPVRMRLARPAPDAVPPAGPLQGRGADAQRRRRILRCNNRRGVRKRLNRERRNKYRGPALDQRKFGSWQTFEDVMTSTFDLSRCHEDIGRRFECAVAVMRGRHAVSRRAVRS